MEDEKHQYIINKMQNIFINILQLFEKDIGVGKRTRITNHTQNIKYLQLYIKERITLSK